MKRLIKLGLLAIVLGLCGCGRHYEVGVVGFFSVKEAERQEKEYRTYHREKDYKEREKEPYVSPLFVIRIN